MPALPSFLSEVFLPPPSLCRTVRLSLPWRLKSDPLSLYFSLSMAPATATTHREVHHCDKQVALLTVDTLFAKWSTSLWPARGEFPIRERPVITHLERTVARVCDTCLRTIRLHHHQVLLRIAIYYCLFLRQPLGNIIYQITAIVQGGVMIRAKNFRSVCLCT